MLIWELTACPVHRRNTLRRRIIGTPVLLGTGQPLFSALQLKKSFGQRFSVARPTKPRTRMEAKRRLVAGRCNCVGASGRTRTAVGSPQTACRAEFRAGRMSNRRRRPPQPRHLVSAGLLSVDGYSQLSNWLLMVTGLYSLFRQRAEDFAEKSGFNDGNVVKAREARDRLEFLMWLVREIHLQHDSATIGRSFDTTALERPLCCSTSPAWRRRHPPQGDADHNRG
jgi:hypothetical protein